MLSSDAMNARRLTYIAVVCLFSVLSFADEDSVSDDAQPRFVPARLPDSFELAVDQIDGPAFDYDSEFFLYCIARVYSNGRVGDNYCIEYVDVDDDKLRNAVNKLMGRTRLSPAMVDGERREVKFYYRLSFRTSGRVRVFPNWGHDVDRLGMSYEAPQRYSKFRQYPPACDFYSGLSMTPIAANGRVAGEPELKTLLRREDRALNCVEIIKKQLSNAKFIPGHRDGKPVPAIHEEIWRRWDWLDRDSLSMTLGPPQQDQ